MRFVLSAVLGLAILGAAAVTFADEPPNDRPLSEWTCEELQSFFGEAEASAEVYVPPPTPPECPTVCAAMQLAACATSPKACGGLAAVLLADGESTCICDKFDATPAGGAPK
jgi:hypothetical protein